jgi:hypothetical protein
MKRVINKVIARILLTGLFTAVPVMLVGQTTSDGSMPQYYFQNFTPGKVKLKSGQVQTPMLNYNAITEKMVFTRDGKYYDISNPEMIDTVIVMNTRFVPVGRIFYEVLLTGPAALFIQHKGELMPAGKQVGYGGTSQLASSVYVTSVELSGGRYNLPLPSDYIVKITPVYWIRRNNEMFSFLNEKQLMNLYPEKAKEIKAFIKGNRIKIENREHLIKLVNFCSSLE